MYYDNKLGTLRDIFADKEAAFKDGFFFACGKQYPVINDVIILCDPSEYTVFVKNKLAGSEGTGDSGIARDIQSTFGEEWKSYSKILPEHEKEFLQYFDLTPPETLKGKRCADLGCGMGRWSYFLSKYAKEIILVDFSDAIFVARENLKERDNCLFFMCDLKKMPFRDNFADFIFSLGVLHHLPAPCLEETRKLKKYAPELLIFLYYALDNRPVHYRLILKAVTIVRSFIWRIENKPFRKLFSLMGTYFLYIPLVILGKILRPFGIARHVPLYDFYKDKSPKRIEQDVYDRFFTRIEQRVTRKQILALKDTFQSVTVSENIPYWHFLLK
jgi:SAM-dependent methyltransferase